LFAPGIILTTLFLKNKYNRLEQKNMNGHTADEAAAETAAPGVRHQKRNEKCTLFSLA